MHASDIKVVGVCVQYMRSAGSLVAHAGTRMYFFFSLLSRAAEMAPLSREIYVCNTRNWTTKVPIKIRRNEKESLFLHWN
jgi:hypothetical protein